MAFIYGGNEVLAKAPNYLFVFDRVYCSVFRGVKKLRLRDRMENSDQSNCHDGDDLT